MRWWYFHIKAGGLELAKASSFGDRPKDANPARGNPHTPWYKEEEHLDKTHIHVRGSDYSSALSKAKIMYASGKSSSYIGH